MDSEEDCPEEASEAVSGEGGGFRRGSGEPGAGSVSEEGAESVSRGGAGSALQAAWASFPI